MALNAAKTGKKIADLITDSRASEESKAKIIQLWTEIMSAIYTDVKSDMEITVPNGQVVVAVAGSATATMNVSPIPCGIDEE